MDNELSRSLNINFTTNTGTGNSVQANSIDMTGVRIDVHNITQQPTIEKEHIWFDVREPVKSFIGRDVELKDLHDAFQSENRQVEVTQTIAVSGLGGIGKSELARKYAHENKKVYGGNVIWISAETQESLRKSIQGLAKELAIPITEKRDEKEHERDIKSILKDVYKYLQNGKSLFIFDNAEEYKDINQFLPSSISLFPDNKKPYVLITSRNRDWDVEEEGDIKLLQLGELTPEEAAQFIRKALELEDNVYDLQKSEIEQLAKKLQYFPLALRQAISYIKQRNKKLKLKGGKKFEITDYLKEYDKEVKQLLDFEYGSDRYTKTTFVTWKVTIENIKQKEYGQEALNILNILAYLAPDKVPIDNFFSKLVADEEKLWEAVQLLSQYSMINVEKGVSNIHRLVQQVVRLGLQNESKEEEILNKGLKLINRADWEEEDHVISIWEYASKYGKLIDDYYFNSFYGHWKKNTPLHLLVKNDCNKAIKAILTHVEINYSNKLTKIVNAINESGRTPLPLAIESGNFIIVKYLIEEKGADFSVPDNDGKTCLHWAASSGRLDVVKYLIEEKGANFNVPDKYGKTPLHWAAERGQLDLVKYLIEEKGVDFNVPDIIGRTPLHWAAERGRLDVVKYLIEEKVTDFNVRDNDGSTPLNLAAAMGKLDVVKYLIEEKGADFNVPDKIGRTPLDWAEHSDVVRYLKSLVPKNG